MREKREISKITFLLALLMTFSVNFDSAVVIPIIANYAILLGASQFMAGIIVGIYSIVHIPSNILLGRIVDRVGRKLPLAIGLSLDAFSLMLYSIARDPTSLFFARLIHGVGGGFGGPATMSYLGDITPKEVSGRRMALYGISVAFALLIGFTIGGIGVHFFGYAALFRGTALLLFLMAVFSLILPTTYNPPMEKISFREELLIFKHTVLRRVMIPSYLSIFTVNFNLGIITAVYAVVLKVTGYTHAHIGMFFALMVLFSIITHYPAGILGDRIGKRRIIILGLIFTAVSFIILSFSTELLFPILGMIVLGIGHGMIFPTAAGLICDNTISQNRGVATGTFYGLIVAGIAVGAPIAGLIFEVFGAYYAIISGTIVSVIAIGMISSLK